tara:strand:- start:46 stop:507 length:462 start_codon:yes stop_codon:yes gene_type:complete
MKQIFNSNNITELLADCKDQRITFTNGCFDLLHPGHIDYLTKAKSYGDILIVGLNSDESVTSLKGENRPINNQEFRAMMLIGLKPVDYVVIFNEETPIELIKKIQPTTHVKGGDYSATELPEYEVVIASGGNVQIVPFLDGFSSTSLINKIRE